MRGIQGIDKGFRTDHPPFRAGDTVRVHVRIVEGDKERVQVFEGVVIQRHRGGIHETFTVRKVSYGVGVERIFPLHSPNVARIEVKSRGRVRRSRALLPARAQRQGRPDPQPLHGRRGRRLVSCSGSALAFSAADASALAALRSLDESTDSPRSRAIGVRSSPPGEKCRLESLTASLNTLQ